jgi:hypothetical protein
MSAHTLYLTLLSCVEANILSERLAAQVSEAFFGQQHARAYKVPFWTRCWQIEG